MTSKAVQRATAGAVTERTREAWSEEQINLIASTVAEGASRAQLYMFLELAARYDLDPFAKEIWCAVPKNQDGTPRRDKVMIMVGRDGFLKIAQRHPDYRGMDSDVVRENDDFNVVRTEDNKRLITHKYGRDRGKAVAAYAIVYRDGREPTYFHAAIEDFRPANPNSNTQWAKGPGPMILKCAEASALRRAFSITGIVAEEEVARDLEAGQAVPVPEPEGPPELVDRIRSLFDQARVLDQDAYTPAKQRLMLAGASEARLGEVEEELRTFITRQGGVVAETVESVEEPDDIVAEGDRQMEEDERIMDALDDQSPEPGTDPTAQVEDAPEDPVRKAAERAMAAHGVDPEIDPDQLDAEEAKEQALLEPEAADDDGSLFAENMGRFDRDPEDDDALQQGELDYDDGDGNTDT